MYIYLNIFLNWKKSSMWLKEILKKEFWDPKIITVHRYKAAKFLFVFAAFMFFVNFFFVWAKFYSNELVLTLPYTYLFFLMSLFYYLYFLFKNIFIGKISNFLFYILFFILVNLLIFLLLPIAVKWGVLYFLN